jgi:hypothetical protein
MMRVALLHTNAIMVQAVTQLIGTIQSNDNGKKMIAGMNERMMKTHSIS